MDKNNTIAYFKIHPAIGVAHLGAGKNQAATVEFFQQVEAFQKALGNEEEEIKIYQEFKNKEGFAKQSVEFSIHAYDEKGNWLYKLDNNEENISWNIDIANRKLHNYSKKTEHKFLLPEIKGKCIEEEANKIKIVGNNPWNGNTEIDLGEFSKGIFTPPIAALYNKTGKVDSIKIGDLDQYPADASYDPVTKNNLKLDYTDNTSDGIVSAYIDIKDDNDNIITVAALPAWLVVAPPRTNVFFTPSEAEIIKNTGRNIYPLENTNYNLDFIKKTSALLGINNHFQYEDCTCASCKEGESKRIREKIQGLKADSKNRFHLLKSNFFCKNNPYHLDFFMMNTLNGDYDPGMEICLSGDDSRNEANFNIAKAFMKAGKTPLRRNEIRVKPFDEDSKTGTKAGQLTSGLCSTWQGDLMACLNFWTAENPLTAYNESIEKGNLEAIQNEAGEIIMHKDNDKDNRFNYAEEIHLSIGKQSLVYHEYDEKGNVYFIKVPDKKG